MNWVSELFGAAQLERIENTINRMDQKMSDQELALDAALAAHGQKVDALNVAVEELITSAWSGAIQREWWVSLYTSNPAAGDGRTPGTAFQKLNDAINAAQNGDTIYVVGDYNDYWGGVIVNKSVRIIGRGNKTIIGIDNQGGAYDANSCVMKVTAQGVQLENFRIGGPTDFPGVHLMLDGASFFQGRSLDVGAAPGTTPTAYPTSAEAGTGRGGIGILTNNMEGMSLRDVNINGCSIGLGMGNESSTNRVDRMTISSCYQDIVGNLFTSEGVGNTVTPGPWAYGCPTGGGGGWTFSHFKDTNPINRPSGLDVNWDNLPVIQLNGSGAHVFEAMDVSEGAFQIVDIDSEDNTFIRPVSAPATVYRIKGDRNHFIAPIILGAGWIVDGDHNTFDGRRCNGSFRGSGSHNRFRNTQFTSNDVITLGFTGEGNIFESECRFYALSGPPIDLSMLGTNPKFDRVEATVSVDFSQTVTIDLRKGTTYMLDIGDGAWTLQNPIDSGNETTPENVMLTKEIVLELHNAAAAAPGPVTLGSKWKLAGPLPTSATGTRTVLKAIFNGTDCVEVSRTSGIAA